MFERMKIRKIPNLIFQLDESIDYAYKISDLLKTSQISSSDQVPKKDEK